MSIQKLEAELEATRQKIAKQLSMVGRSIQSIDPTLHEKERELEQAVIDAHLDTPAVMELLTPPVKRFFRDGVEHTLTQEQSNEEIDAFIERKILEEQDTTDWKQELRDFINDKSKKYDMPRDKHGYVNLMAQLAANNEIDRKRLAALRARAQEEQDDEG